MTDHRNLDDLEHRESINAYLAAMALVAEGRRDDAFAFISSLDPTEQLDMWIAGISITISFANDCRQHHAIPVGMPEWLRMMAALENGDAQ